MEEDQKTHWPEKKGQKDCPERRPFGADQQTQKKRKKKKKIN
jgi:hypothetical protein